MNETRKRGSILRKETGFQVGNRIVLPTPEPEQQPAGQPNMKQELTEWLDKVAITSDNIGQIRRECFVPWDSEWNGIVRDETAARENKMKPTSTASELEQLAREAADEIFEPLPLSKGRTFPIILSVCQKVQELTRKTDLKAAVKAAQALGRPASKPDEPPTVQPDAGAATADKPDRSNSAHMSLGMTMNWNDTNPQPTSSKQEALESAEANCDRLAHENHRKHQEIQQLREQLAAAQAAMKAAMTEIERGDTDLALDFLEKPDTTILNEYVEKECQSLVELLGKCYTGMRLHDRKALDAAIAEATKELREENKGLRGEVDGYRWMSDKDIATAQQPLVELLEQAYPFIGSGSPLRQRVQDALAKVKEGK